MQRLPAVLRLRRNEGRAQLGEVLIYKVQALCLQELQKKNQTQQQKTPNHIHHLYYISDCERSFPAVHFTSILPSIVFSFPNQKVSLSSFRELFHSLINFSVKLLGFFFPCYKAYIFLFIFFQPTTSHNAPSITINNPLFSLTLFTFIYLFTGRLLSRPSLRDHHPIIPGLWSLFTIQPPDAFWKI